MKEKLISIIVPVYKAEKYLDRCVQSIVAQTYKNIEVLLVEDGSPDISGKICDEWAKKDNRIKVIHKENGGASSARNAGIKAALGEYIGFVDSDDWIEPNMYERMYYLIKQYDADMAICQNKSLKSRTTPARKEPKIEVWNKKEHLDYIFRVNGQNGVQSVWARLINRSILKDFSFIEGRMNEDIHACYYYATKSKRVVYTNEEFYIYFHNDEGVTQSGFTEKKMDLIYIWDVVKEMTIQLTPEYTYACEMNCKRARFTLLSQMYVNGYDKQNPTLETIRKQLKAEVRAYCGDLLKWKMPLSRKILLILVCI